MQPRQDDGHRMVWSVPFTPRPPVESNSTVAHSPGDDGELAMAQWPGLQSLVEPSEHTVDVGLLAVECPRDRRRPGDGPEEVLPQSIQVSKNTSFQLPSSAGAELTSSFPGLCEADTSRDVGDLWILQG
jgi:hypothetical protein